MLKKIFSITNEKETCNKVVTILGIKFRYKSIKLLNRRFEGLENKLQLLNRRFEGLENKLQLLNKNYEVLEKKLKPLLKYSRLTKRQINTGIVDVKIEKFKKHKTIGVNETEKRNPRLIVSLTSFPDRMYDIKYAIFSLLNQTVKPDKVILWLAQEQFPGRNNDIPDEVLSLQEHGLTIEYTKDIRSYKKLIPSFEKYPDDIIISADDDIYYPENWLELLYNEYLKDPKNVYAHRVQRIKFLDDNTLKPYMEWDRNINDNSLSLLNFPSTGGGVLYPPHILYKDYLNEAIFKKLSPCSDEIWFWAMVILNRVKVKVVENAINVITITNALRESLYSNEVVLFFENVNDKDVKNTQIKNILEYYPDLLKILKSEHAVCCKVDKNV